MLWDAGELEMNEIWYIGILVSQRNGCAYCTAALCAILNHGLGESEGLVSEFLQKGTENVNNARHKHILEYALKVNNEPAAVTDADTDG